MGSLWPDYFCKPVFYVPFPSDLFEKMVPMAVQQSMSIYSQRKAETVNRLVGTMREATNLCNGYAIPCLYEPTLLCLCTTMCIFP